MLNKIFLSKQQQNRQLMNNKYGFKLEQDVSDCGVVAPIAH